MGINRFFQFFLPKEPKFLNLLTGQVDDIVKASDLLIAFLQTPAHEQRKALYAEIKQVEMHCDRLTTQILDELNNTFITPFDREDIHELAAQLDDVLDLINGSAKRVVLYQPKVLTTSMVELAEYVRQSAECLQIAVAELDKVKKNPSVVKQQVRRMHEIENLADDVYEHYIMSLFENEKDAIELFKHMEIMQMLENATDKAYRVTDVLKTIIVKYA
ncbi:DUF47 family protein [Parabacteroides sp. OttesenSCG-928-G07]|nr:DUF47 family protein [Parabacteroides sp. OttesenSCG-928-G21]MDL2278107.1 DUF47 family protein [Parabacteroides sp. OttesenSCG-928-G07]